jgi:hypothetical protein
VPFFYRAAQHESKAAIQSEERIEKKRREKKNMQNKAVQPWEETRKDCGRSNLNVTPASH